MCDFEFLFKYSINKTLGGPPMNLRKISIDLAIGQQIQLGSRVATITKIEQHSSGDISIGTTRGSRKVLTFRLLPDKSTAISVPADKYR
jgi:hypothetical protein